MAKTRQSSARRHHARVTLSDVAGRAGVSPMTVSRVINGEANVRESTRDAVNAAIRALGYSPNKAARSLASASQVQVGLLYTNPSSTYLSAMLLGVLEQARESDTQVIVAECEPGADAERVVEEMQKAGMDGILLVSPLADSPDLLESLLERDVLTVTMGSRNEKGGVTSVTIDERGAARTMTDYLLSLGHRRIAFITGSRKHVASELRLAGHREALKHAGIEPSPELIVPGRFTYRSGLEAAERLLALPDRPTAIFASNDDMAAASIAVAHRHRIDVPADLSVVGFDDTLLATTVWPEITTIRQPIGDMSHIALEALARSIRARRDGIELDCEDLTLEYGLIERESTAVPRFGAERDLIA